MFDNVLVGVNGSRFGRDAVALAATLKEPGGKLTLAFVQVGILALEGGDELLEGERHATKVEADLLSFVGWSPGQALHEQAERQGADLLVVGSCSHSAFGRAMLGDDTRAALNGASCGVAIASRGFAEHGGAIKRIGVGYNGSPESEAVLALARQLAAQTGASIHALEVVSLPLFAYTGFVAPGIGGTIDALLDEARNRVEALPGVEGRAIYGFAGEELAAFSSEVDILVVGSRGYGPAKRLVLGSTSNYLERHARCSLLVWTRSKAPGRATP